MGSKHQISKPYSSSSSFPSFRSTILLTLALLLTSFLLFVTPPRQNLGKPLFGIEDSRFKGDLREIQFPWNKLCFGTAVERLKLAVFSKTWPVGADPGGMERHAATLYTDLASRGHEVHVFTVPSDRRAHPDIHEGNLHVHFAANDHGSVNCSLAFEIFNRENKALPFDYVHSESVSLPHWRAKMVPKVAVTWHGIWYEIMHSKLFQGLISDPQGLKPGSDTELRDAMPRLVEEIRFFPSYTQHICISNSAAEVLTNIYQLPRRNVHVILNGVDDTKFVHEPEAGVQFRNRYKIPINASLVMGVAGRLVRDKGHPLLYEAFSLITELHPSVFLLVAGSGPWEKRYAELGSSVRVLGALDPTQLAQFYNAIDIFVNPTLRPQGLDLTLMEAMQCGKPVLTPNYPSITGTVVINEGFGYTFSPNVGSFVEALETAINDGPAVLHRKGMECKTYALSMFTATKMASAYERFFLCMKNPRYCHYPLPTDG
ncbi:Glycosyl transferase [Macleaya cordata]|uniref:Glycosyl transferase n=1 Tax=Macleaya cordata TaxID=56857 RepID=A0A200QIM5_MACCD|nr:Glycosyl transferase [Macleaya cordata]